MRLCGAALFLQTLLNFHVFFAAALDVLQEERRSAPENTSQNWVTLQEEFDSSLLLSRELLSKTQALTRRYRSERLSEAQLLLVSQSRLLPSASLNLHTWFSLSDAARLSYMAKTLKFYQGLVQQLKNHEERQKDSKFQYQFEELDLDLRDLSLQISLGGLLSEVEPVPTLKPLQILQHQNPWTNRQEVYHVLRSLESVLRRAVRDFLVLRMRAAQYASLQGDLKGSGSQSLP
ncbi:interleukin-27 subunit alpha-like isoform X2 [Hemicordylus capensis]|uniref:interleukin-27 subunit alpha-like isoform X2 n=1 Tax=Hemicordylus capensis TaxID=884348 RepID=UPI00230478CD|nr:interleukin-27 subunit alpha-like isoform X2 [Hemicordylus capensis]